MGSNDIFSKLTCGAKFSSRNNFPRRSPLIKSEQPIACLEKVKKEENDPMEHHGNNFSSTALPAEIEIKSEASSAESGDEQPAPPKAKKQKVLSAETLEQMRRCKMKSLRKSNKIYIKKGKKSPDVPDMIETFGELTNKYNVSHQLVGNIVACYNNKPTPVQMQAIPVLLHETSLHACAPTGSGKTAAFLIPILHHLKAPMKCGFRALIICPTRELALQTQREALRLGDGMNLRTHVIRTVDDRRKCDYSLDGGRKYDILVTTPNRICYLLSQNPPQIDLSNIQWVVVDEADKLFEDSKNSFREQLDTVLNACVNPTKVIALFSATQTREADQWVAANVPRRIRFCIGLTNSAVELVDQKLLFTGSEGGKLLAFRELVAQGLNPPVLVFVQSKDRAQQLFTELIYDGLNVDVIHSDRSQRERDNVVRAFREGKIWILICTELMSRGIDFKGVNLVVNYDFPPSTISYVHRIGRTGRAGRTGKAVTFFTKEDTANLKSIAQLVKTAGGEVPDYMLQLRNGPKRDREKLAFKAPKRAIIRTLPSFELQQLQRKKKFVAKSKEKMRRSEGEKGISSTSN
ncbi:DEAD box protein 52 homolog [Anopheles bellator]|uniref:DEAD box protein 52 homolog n=1 Tax=Anopheles bellator TaxID=139047 RepID=UPI0026496A4F|nr:DEAD box protein 52 homolog [Anopheles bellator]